jgi:hypothetical protein
MVAPEQVAPSPEALALAQRLKVEGGRVYPLDLAYSPAYYAARAVRAGNHEVWSFALLADTFSPDTNLRTAVPTALTTDRTMLVPTDRVTLPERASPEAVVALLPRLRAAAVSHVVTVDTLAAPFVLDQVMATHRLKPVVVRVYRVPNPRPLVEPMLEQGATGRVLSLVRRGDRLDLVVEMHGAGRLLLREALGRGWTARVDGDGVVPEPAEAHYVALRVPAGRHRVQLVYHPPLLFAGVAVTALSALAALCLALGGGAAIKCRPA